MHTEAKDWTHKDVRISDIRKLSEFYIFTIESKKSSDGCPAESELIIDTPLMVKDKIFEERLKPYFLKDAFRVSREEILSVYWNMYITRGYYVKIVKGHATKFDMDPDKYYVSYLEIAGPLGSFCSICKDKDSH
jgi:hypothetical protein